MGGSSSSSSSSSSSKGMTVKQHRSSVASHSTPIRRDTAGMEPRRLQIEEEEIEEKEEETVGEEGEEEEEEFETEFEATDLEVVVVIALFLIMATLAFEFMKDSLEESVTEDLEVILEKLFGELTILGFLAIVTFVLTQTGVLQKISIKVFGEEEELLEYFESVHFSIFFIMVAFVIQVLILIQEASETEKQWEDMDIMSRMGTASQRSLSITKSSRDAILEYKKESFWMVFCPQFRNQKAELKRMHLIFKALREEFILERSLDPSFAPAPHNQRVETDFNFGRYLSLAQAHTLTRIVEVEERTWFLFALSTCAFFGMCLAVGRDIEIIAWLWVGIGWAVLLFNLAFEKHLVHLRNQFIPKKLLYKATDTRRFNSSIKGQGGDGSGPSTENTYLVGSFYGTHGEDLPSWCDVDLDEYRRKRNIFTKCLVGGKPNRQQSLFFMDSFGPSLYFILLQANLVFVGVYAGLHLLTFMPFIFEIYFWPLRVLFVVLAALPIIGISYNKKRLVAALSQVVSIGAYRKPQIVSDVLLETKTGRVVRTFLIIHKMWHTAHNTLAGDAKPAVATPTMNDPLSAESRGDSFSALEQEEVSKSFDALDADHSGAISHQEFRDLLTRLGADLTDDAFMRMVSTLDADGDGEVTKQEFLDWYKAHSAADSMSLHERAKDLFEMFDDDHSGELTIGELKSKIDALGMGFTVDEIGAIVNELDKDRSGTVSEEEFLQLLEKYYPKELSENYDHDE